jgi:hypothetical protein
MAVGLSAYTANKILDGFFNNTSFAITSVYVKLHTGDPGVAGASNAATETTRKLSSWAAAAAGSIATDTIITWTAIAGSQDATHASLWDAAAAGNFLGSGLITAAAYLAGDDWKIPVGGIVCSFPLAA